MLNIKDRYIDNCNNIYNIRNISFDKKEDLSSNLGTFITETMRETNGFYTNDDNIYNGVYIYKSNYDSTKSLRIYKDWADYKYVIHNDASLINNLQNLQKNIKLTNFPTGVVTLENYLIGQEIPYYEGYKTLYQSLEDIRNLKLILFYYKKIILILQELEKNNIIYVDLHAKNFMIKDNNIYLIDFENDSIKINKNGDYYIKMINNLKNMINNLNKYMNIDFSIEENTLETIKEEINVKSKKI